MSPSVDTQRVLSIQSHVVSGYVGNKSATFPLQVLGFEVDPINSVQFSNHKGYKTCRGQILGADELWSLYTGLKENGLNTYSHLLTGFIGSESFLRKVSDVVSDLKEINPNLIYVCDPVMGDLGRMYVPKELLPIYQECILPIADVITPNQFEAELLSGMKITSEAEGQQAMRILHEMGAKTVVISSSELGNGDVLVGFGSTMKDGEQRCFKTEVPKLPANFTGTGDLFAALLLAWNQKCPDNLQEAVGKTQSTMQAVLSRTMEHAKLVAGEGKEPTRAQLELRLVQSKKDIENPAFDTVTEITYPNNV